MRLFKSQICYYDTYYSFSFLVTFSHVFHLHTCSTRRIHERRNTSSLVLINFVPRDTISSELSLSQLISRLRFLSNFI